jgi:hypothetical protein
MPSAVTVINGHGDDLDDGLDLDSGLLARSDAEDEDLDLEAGDADAHDDDDEEGHTQIVEGLDDDEDDVPPVQKVTDVKAKKRKAADESPREQSRAVKKVNRLATTFGSADQVADKEFLVDGAVPTRTQSRSFIRFRALGILQRLVEKDLLKGLGDGAERSEVTQCV